MIPQDTEQKEITAPDYIRANFDPSDRLAVFVRNRRSGDTLQRISTAFRIAAPQFQDWLRYKNERDDCDIYLDMNSLILFSLNRMISTANNRQKRFALRSEQWEPT